MQNGHEHRVEFRERFIVVVVVLFVSWFTFILTSCVLYYYYYNFCYDNERENQKTCVIPGVGGVLPRDGSAPGCAPGPKLPLDEPFVAYSLDDLAADAYN